MKTNLMENQEQNPSLRSNPKQGLVVGIIGILATVYLLNPTAGFIEFLPDNLPVVGNLDEAGVTAILMACLAYFGLDLTRFIKRNK